MRRRRSGFSLIELIVVVTIGLILISIFLPYARRVRETSNRSICADNLRQIGIELLNYARANNGFYPRSFYDQINRPTGWSAFEQRGGAPNDVTASLWLLSAMPNVKPKLFICPSTSDRAGADLKSGDARFNFSDPRQLSYSYANPFSNAAEYGLTEYLPADFVLLADLNPGKSGGSDVTAVRADAGPFEFTKANSHNHGRAGQNVLFAPGYVQFMTTPYCGTDGDNIYTAIADYPVFSSQKPNHRTPGVLGTQYSPAWRTDSFLVPTADQRNP